MFRGYCILLRRTGFTLIEVLAALVIIAVLAALLFPVVASARRKGQQAQCASNLMQIGKALTIYRADYDGYWPPSGHVGPDRDRAWGYAVKTYAKASGSLACPQVVRNDSLRLYGTVPGYAINYWLEFRAPTIHENQVTHPSTTVAFCDAIWGAGQTLSPDAWLHSNPPIPNIEHAWKRHQDGANYLFCDNHLKWYKPEAVQAAYPRWKPSLAGSIPLFEFRP